MEYLPLTHGQKWCMNEITTISRPGWYTIEFFVKSKVPLNEALLKKSVLYLVNKYESLRVKLIRKNGEWMQEVYPITQADPFVSHDLSEIDGPARLAEVKRLCMQERDGLLPQNGNLVRIVFFRFSVSEGRIWFGMHHMVSDFVSALIFAAEFMAVYNSFLLGKELKWQVSRDYRKWLYLLEGYCRDVLIPSEQSYWASLPWEKARILPPDYTDRFYDDQLIIDAIRNRQIVHTYHIDTCWMDQATTRRVFSKAGADLEDMLIAVFFLALAGNRDIDCLDINVCNAGRKVLPADYEINSNSLLGFLAITRAVLLQRPRTGQLLTDIQEVMNQIKSIPNGGVGFTFISDYQPDEQARDRFMQLRAQGEIFFNYLGRVNTNFSNDQFATSDEDTGQGDYASEVRNNLLASDVGIMEHSLFIKISYSDVYFKKSTIANIMQSMILMLEECIAEQPIEN